MAKSDRVIPATILTGFLGAGKTTLLNHLLSTAKDCRFAVIVNELGEIPIDHELVVDQQEDMLVLSNGCVCCSIRTDLIRGLQNLLKRADFDYILIETTGIADPAPLAQTFVNIPALREFVQLDAIVTVVDAEQMLKHMRASETALDQIAMADFLILNKIDLVDEKTLEHLEAQIREINPQTGLVHAVNGQVPWNMVLDIHAFDLDKKLAADPAFLDEMRKRKHEKIDSVSFTFDTPFLVEPFERTVQAWSESLRIYRSKGLVWVKNQERRAVFHGVNNRFHIFWEKPWKSSDTPRSELVFIGEDLPRERMEADLRACLAPI